MTIQKVAIITAGGSGMGAPRPAVWHRTVLQLPFCHRPARAKPSPKNWGALALPARTSPTTTCKSWSTRLWKNGGGSTFWSTAPVMGRAHQFSKLPTKTGIRNGHLFPQCRAPRAPRRACNAEAEIGRHHQYFDRLGFRAKVRCSRHRLCSVQGLPPSPKYLPTPMRLRISA